MNAAINPTVLNNESANHFEQLAAISVSGHIEKKTTCHICLGLGPWTN